MPYNIVFYPFNVFWEDNDNNVTQFQVKNLENINPNMSSVITLEEDEIKSKLTPILNRLDINNNSNDCTIKSVAFQI